MQAFCSSCGASISETARFCSYCGAKQVDGPASATRYTSSAAVGGGTLAVGSQLDGNRYQIVRLINQGSFGAVYEATAQRMSGRACAIKELRLAPGAGVLPHEAQAWFAREAELLMDLRHPMLPRILDQSSENGRHYLVMDLIAGHNLDEELAA
jgi:serine/threonine protein kinase